MVNRKEFISRLGGVALGLTAFGIHDVKSSNLEKFPSKGTSDLVFWKNLRKQFPLKEDLIFLNNGTNGIVPNVVLNRVSESLLHTNKNAIYGGGTEKLLEELAVFLNVEKEEVGLSHNVTEGNNIICWGLPLKKGDEVLISDQEHVGNALTWLNRQKVEGIVVKSFSALHETDIILENIKKGITSKTRVITLPHILCTTGQIMPIKEICALAKEKGIYTVIDGAHGPGMLQMDLKDLGCDAYTSCGHKWMLAPAGTGFFYLRKELLNEVQAKFVGAHSDLGWDINKGISEYYPSAHRYYYGTQSAALYEGLTEAIHFHRSIGTDLVEKRCKELANHLYDGLLNLNSKVNILSSKDPKNRGGIIGFKFKEKASLDFYKFVFNKGYKVRIVPESNLDSLRVSTHVYNSIDEVDGILKLIKEF